jgi:ABC-2 type transport system permease protein
VRPALHAEWTKLRTVAGPSWLLLAAVVLTVALSAFAAASARYAEAGPGLDLTRLSLTGIDLGQAVVVVLAVLAVSDEYGSGTIQATLTALPRRSIVLAAKAAVVGAVVLAAGVIAVLGSLLAGRLILPGHGFTVAHGYALLSLVHGSTLRAVVGSVLYLALIALLSVGVATAVRSSAAAVGIVLGVLYLAPIIIAVVPDAHWQRHLQQIAPMTAGLGVQATVNLPSLPISPWAGLGVLACWAAGALVVGGLLLTLRDA